MTVVDPRVTRLSRITVSPKYGKVLWICDGAFFVWNAGPNLREVVVADRGESFVPV